MRIPSAIVFVLLPLSASAAPWYVSPNGNDNNSGLSPSAAWKTISKVNKKAFAPGDTIFFEGGGTFSGTLSPSRSGSATAPITYDSYGTGRATISSGSNNGLTGSNVSGIAVRNLNFIGSGPWSNTADGVFFSGANKTYIRLDRLTVSGYGGRGVYFKAGNSGGFSDVQITNVTSNNNIFTGIEIGGVYQPGSISRYNNRNFYIARCLVFDNYGKATFNNHSGDGILAWDIDGITIERCVAHHNGRDNSHCGGPIGIWVWQATNAVIQFNESYSNLDGSGCDGGGFDLDGGTTSSVMQYNYSHDNDGAGYLVYKFSGAAPLKNCTVRYNISQNDGRTNLAGIVTGGGVDNIQVYNNTSYAGPGSRAAIDIWGDTYNSAVRNNILLSDGSVPVVIGASATFQGNLYWNYAGFESIAGHDSLDLWRLATGQERLNGADTGIQLDPSLIAPGAAPTLNNADLLNSLSHYRSTAASIGVNRGLNLSSLFGIQSGPHDFYQTTIPQHSTLDVGASEYSGTLPSTPAAPTNLVAQVESAVQVRLMWRDNAINETACEIEAARAGSSFQLYASVSPTQEAVLTDLRPGTVYSFRVRYINSSGASNWSNTVTATVPAGTVPAGWTATDVGAPAIAGTAHYDSGNGRWTVFAGGADIWDSSDQFHFVAQPLTGDGSVVARVDSFTFTNGWAKAGVMIRDGYSASAAFADVVVTPGNGITFQGRHADGVLWMEGVGGNAPAWVKLTRSGNTCTGYWSSNGQDWTAIGSRTFELAANAVAGLCLTAHNSQLENVALFQRVSVIPANAIAIVHGGVYEFEPQCAPGLRLRAAGTQDGANADTLYVNDSPPQRWRAIAIAADIFEFEPVNAPGLRLDVLGGSAAMGTNVQLWTSNNLSHQRWKVLPSTNGYVELEPQNAIGMRLDTSGASRDPANVQIWGMNSSAAQRWRPIAH